MRKVGFCLTIRPHSSQMWQNLLGCMTEIIQFKMADGSERGRAATCGSKKLTTRTGRTWRWSRRRPLNQRCTIISHNARTQGYGERSSLNTERSERFYLVVTKISLSPPRPKDTEAGERVRNLSREAWCWSRTNSLGVRQQRQCNRHNRLMSKGLRISLKQGIHPEM